MVVVTGVVVMLFADVVFLLAVEVSFVKILAVVVVVFVDVILVVVPVI